MQEINHKKKDVSNANFLYSNLKKDLKMATKKSIGQSQVWVHVNCFKGIIL